MLRFLFKHFVALLLVMLIHVVAFMPMSLDPGSRGRPDSPRKPVCRTVFGRGPYARPELIEWCRLTDPTLFAVSHPRYGFSANVKQTLPEAYTPTPQPEFEVPIPPPDVPAVPESVPQVPALPPQRPLMALSAERPEEVYTASDLSRGAMVVWSWGDGRTIVGAPELDAEEIRAMATKDGVSGPTELEISRLGDNFRLRLLESCGSPVLDQLAMARFGANLSRIEVAGSKVDVMGRDMTAGDVFMVLVEWRLVLTSEGRDAI